MVVSWESQYINAMMVMMVVPSNNEDEYEDVDDNNCADHDDK